MKIKSATVLVFERKLDGRAYNPVFRWHERRAPLIVIETEAGARGIGEAWSRYTDVESVLNALAFRLAPRLQGRTVAHPLNAASGIAGSAGDEVAAWAWAAAISAVDIALWDAFGQERGEPVWRLLGGSSDVAPVYASGGLYRDDYPLHDLQSEMAGYVDQGFRAFKVKVAGLSRADDLDRVQAVRHAIGPESMLWVDAVNQLDVASASEWCAGFSRLGVVAIQSPLPFDDLAGMAHLNRAVMPVIAAESEFRPSAFQELLKRDAVSQLQFCLPLCGGFSGAGALDDMAKAQGISTTPQCFSTAIAQAATLHFAAARSNVGCAEYHCYHDHLKALYRGTTGRVTDGRASAGNLPGLGVAVPDCGVQPDGSVIRSYEASGQKST